MKGLLIKIIEKHKGKILNPYIDVYIPKNENNKILGHCVVIIDGWTSLDIEEVTNENKKKEEIKEQEELA